MAKTIYSKRRNFLSARLIQARETAGLTQTQFAEAGIISQTELSKIENGQRRVEFLLLLDLAELYAQPIEFFIPPQE
ncbi:helix-turn-helix domain-containing protein [Thermoflexibacter ruber]|uniref:DNA-binding transcriptional regulator, XRE-family HTH domain n=1 Tax=Thermoflexibacter ruber TaxID=1003 RepID=A0A1I2GIG5_9BACT|nr:helix-turn-helix transcriptional regulator [Thermoflexibacter ruber]SFF16647.1 DNA-binding transcriptional regulator, XRE-family HTH domain [Thermoflexibacter ruber]